MSKSKTHIARVLLAFASSAVIFCITLDFARAEAVLSTAVVRADSTIEADTITQKQQRMLTGHSDVSVSRLNPDLLYSYEEINRRYRSTYLGMEVQYKNAFSWTVCIDKDESICLYEKCYLAGCIHESVSPYLLLQVSRGSATLLMENSHSYVSANSVGWLLWFLADSVAHCNSQLVQYPLKILKVLHGMTNFGFSVPLESFIYHEYGRRQPIDTYIPRLNVDLRLRTNYYLFYSVARILPELDAGLHTAVNLDADHELRIGIQYCIPWYHGYADKRENFIRLQLGVQFGTR